MKSKIRSRIKGKMSIFIAALLIVQLAFINPAPKINALGAENDSLARANTVTNIQDGVTLHCWNWSYKNIEANMALIAEQGFTAIQTSPIQQAKEATKGKPMHNWWVYYQPIGFHIDNTGNSALGTKAEFVSMCNTAHKYGIKVIVDVVANHLANAYGNDLSSAIIDDIEKDPSCWHDYTKNTNDYNSRYEVTLFCMSGLPDLNTGSKKIQNYVLGFLKECIDAGADGFRFDAAKHIETPDDTDYCASDFWPTVINGAVDYAKQKRGIDLYCYGELLDVPGGTLPVTAYTKYMSVTDNQWGNNLRASIESENANVSGFNNKGIDNSQIILWAESHDTYANTNGESTHTTIQNINKTWAIVAAKEASMGLYYARPANMSNTLGSADITGWSYDVVQEANRFHNAYIGQPEYLYNENGILYCIRGTSGVVLVNCKGASASINVASNELSDGTYIDQITGSKFTVSGGRIKGTIGSTGVAVVYKTSKIDDDGVSSAKNIAYIELPSNWGSKVYCYAYDGITGEKNNGKWPGVQMTKVSGNIYKYEVPSDIKAPLVIFYNSDTNRYPADMEAGLNLSGSMIFKNGQWMTYKDTSSSGNGGSTTTTQTPTTTKNNTTTKNTTTTKSETTTKNSGSSQNQTTTKNNGSSQTETTTKNNGSSQNQTTTKSSGNNQSQTTTKASGNNQTETTTKASGNNQTETTTKASGNNQTETTTKTSGNSQTETTTISEGNEETKTDGDTNGQEETTANVKESASDEGNTKEDINNTQETTSSNKEKTDDDGGLPIIPIVIVVGGGLAGAGVFAFKKYKK